MDESPLVTVDLIMFRYRISLPTEGNLGGGGKSLMGNYMRLLTSLRRLSIFALSFCKEAQKTNMNVRKAMSAIF